MTGGYWLGVDLGGTKILSGLFDDNLKLLARSKHHTASGAGSGIRIVHRDRDAEGLGNSQRLGQAHRRLTALELAEEAATDASGEREIF